VLVMFYQASQLQPSTEGPQLFTKDTNLGRAATLESVFADFSVRHSSLSISQHPLATVLPPSSQPVQTLAYGAQA